VAVALVNTTQKLVNNATASGAAQTQSVTCAAGNTLIVGASVSGLGVTNAITTTDNAGNSWSRVTAASNFSSSGAACLDLWYAPITTGGTITLTFSFSGSHLFNAWIREYSGLLTASPLDQAKTAKGTGLALSSGASSATTQADELVVCLGITDDGSNTYSVGSGFGNLVQQQLVLTGSGGIYDTAFEDQIVSATGAQTGTFTASPSSTTWACSIATFKAAAAPAAPPPRRLIVPQAAARAASR
jgi:hypothetical protein